MTRTAAEVEEEVVAQRDQLDRTVEALKDKMTPGQLLDEATRAMGGAGQQVLAKFLDQAKENPMRLAVMGLGLAWLMSSSPKSPSSYAFGAAAASYQQTGDPGPAANSSIGDGVGEAVHSLAEKTSDIVSAAGHKASEIVGGAGHVVADAASSAGRTGGAAASGVKAVLGGASAGAGTIAGEARKQFTDLFHREPLLIGALGLAAGIALGASLPATPEEDALLGPVHDRILGEGKNIATQTLAQASDAGKAALQAIRSELDTADIPGSVHDVAQAAKDALKQHGQG